MLIVAAALLVAGCGTRRDYNELLAAVQGDPAATNPATAGGNNGSLGGGTSTGTGASSTGTGGSVATGSGGTTTGGGATGGGGGATTGGGDGNTAEPTAASQNCTGNETPVVLGSVGALSGVIGSVTGDLPKGGQAWAAAINARGGLACHPVEIVIADDGGDPARHLGVVRRLVEQEGAIALINMVGVLSGQASIDYLNQHQIPLIGAEGATPGFYSSPMHFPQQPMLERIFEANLTAVAAYARSQGLTRMGLFTCVEVSFCAMVDRIYAAVLSAAGMNVVAHSKGSIVQPDYTAACQAGKEAGAEVYFAMLDTAGLQRLAASCASIGYRPLYSSASILAGESLTQNPLMDGLVAGMTVMPYMVTSHPGIQEYQDALAQYLPGVAPSTATVTGWMSGKLLEAAVTKLSEPPTSQDILEGLWTLQGEDIGGLITPVTFTRGQPAPSTPWCYWTMVIRDGAYVSPDNGARVCSG